MNRQIYRTLTWITCISALLFIPFLGGIPLFDWDEVNFAEVAREMILTGDHSRPYIDFVPFWEKPPLSFWMQALSMQIWGINDFAARLPNALCGIVSLNVLYIIGRRLYDHRFGLLWVLAYGGSLLPHLYFRSGIIDPWFNLFIFTSLYFLFRKSSVQSTLIAGVLLGLAVLTKGPVAFLIVLLVVLSYWILRRFRGDLSVGRFIVYSITAAFVFGTWYGVETIRNGPWFVMEFTRYQWELLIKPGAGHSGFPGYHVVVLLFGCFPASVLAIQPLFRRTGGNELQRKFKLWMCILLLVVLVLFSIVQSKIVHYSSLCYFPLTFLATLYVWDLLQEQGRLGMWQKLGINAIALLFLIAGVLLVGFGQKPESGYTFSSGSLESEIIGN